MKALLLFTVLLSSNALASPVDYSSPPSKKLRLTSSPVNEPTSIHAIPQDVLNQVIMPKLTSSTDAGNFKTTDKHNFKMVILNPVDEFLLKCRSGRYLDCRNYALRQLKESTGDFARGNPLRKAVEEENVWAVLALLDVGQFEPDLYFEIFEDYLKEKGNNQLILDALRRKSTEVDRHKAYVLSCKYKNDYVYSYLARSDIRRNDVIALDPENINAYFEDLIRRRNITPESNEPVSIVQALKACNVDTFLDCERSLRKLSRTQHLEALKQAIRDGNLMAAEVLAELISNAIRPDESFGSTIKNAIEGADRKMVYVLLQAFTPRTLRQAGILSHACKYGDQFTVFYATKDMMPRKKKRQDSTIDDAYKQAKIVDDKDAVEYFEKYFQQS